MEEEIVAPSVDLLESMRSIGYSFEAAVADLIDNSLTAGAHEVEIDVDVVNGDYVAIMDDGVGMTPDVAREALRLAGSVGERSEFDLGRFGLGLKTASLSQARCLTVVSLQREVMTGLRWDIDHVRRSRSWSLLVLDSSSIDGLPLSEQLQRCGHGTLVIWSNLDLLLGDSVDKGVFLSQRLTGVRSSLSLVFHRYLKGGDDGFEIRVNGIPLKPTDPFLSANPKTQTTSTEVISIGRSYVEVTAYNLPHISDLTEEERRRPDLGEGMRDAQGFYIYRNRRLISFGHWYGLARMSELTKQTRIQVDLPNTLDNLWQLDVKKSRAEPPASFKTRLRSLIEPILAKGRRVHTYRGRAETTSATKHVWSKIKDRTGFRYEVNLQNPAIEAVLARLESSDAERIISLLRTVAENYPFLDVYQEMAGNFLPSPVFDDDVVIDRLREIRDSGLLGGEPEVVTLTLRNAEPFNTINDLDVLVAQVWKERREPQ